MGRLVHAEFVIDWEVNRDSGVVRLEHWRPFSRVGSSVFLNLIIDCEEYHGVIWKDATLEREGTDEESVRMLGFVRTGLSTDRLERYLQVTATTGGLRV